LNVLLDEARLTKILDNLKLFTGRANPELAQKICDYLEIPLGRGRTELFPDGELIVRVEEDVRGRDCFVVQPTCHPVNAHLMELFIWIDTLKRASAQRVTAVIPYFGYARQDRKDEGRTPITAKLVANLLERAGADRVVSVDLHAAQVQGFFDIPVDHLNAGPVFTKWFEFEAGQSGVCFAGRGEREAGAGLRQHAGRRNLHHRQAAQEQQRNAGGQHHRRRCEEKRADGGRHDHHRRHGDRGVPDSARQWREGDLHRRHARGLCPAGDGAVGGGDFTKLAVTDTIPSATAAIRSRTGWWLSVAELVGEAIHRIHHNQSVSASCSVRDRM
jgi:ribose-phosphate pyrophosphokinase